MKHKNVHLNRLCIRDKYINSIIYRNNEINIVSYEIKTVENSFTLCGQIDKRKVFYDQEPPSLESTTRECGFNYQLLAVIY